MKIVACNSNRPLAEAVAANLNISLTSASIRRFADMEVFVEIHEKRARRGTCSSSSPRPIPPTTT